MTHDTLKADCNKELYFRQTFQACFPISQFSRQGYSENSLTGTGYCQKVCTAQCAHMYCKTKIIGRVNAKR